MLENIQKFIVTLGVMYTVIFLFSLLTPLLPRDDSVVARNQPISPPVLI